MRLASNVLLALPFATALVLAGCGGSGEVRKVGDVTVTGSVASYSYYAEYREVLPNGKVRIYLMAYPTTVAAFAGGNKEFLSKTLIGAGPNKETLVIEQVKEDDLSAVLRKRLVATFRERAAAAVVPVVAPVAAPAVAPVEAPAAAPAAAK